MCLFKVVARLRRVNEEEQRFSALRMELDHADTTASLQTNTLRMSQVSGCTPTRGTEWAVGSGHARSTRIEPVGGSVAFLSKPSLNGVPSASAYDRPIADPPCCDMTVVARDWATSTENPRMFGGSAVYPFGCISTVPPTHLSHASTSAPAQRADTQPEMTTQQRTGQTRIHGVPPAVDISQETFDEKTQQRGKVWMRTILNNKLHQPCRGLHTHVGTTRIGSSKCSSKYRCAQIN